MSLDRIQLAASSVGWKERRRTWPEGFWHDQQPREIDRVHSAARSEGLRKLSTCVNDEQLTKRDCHEQDEQPKEKLDRIQRAAQLDGGVDDPKECTVVKQP